MANKKQDRVRFSDIEKKYDVKMDYFSGIFFMLPNNNYPTDLYIKMPNNSYVHVHRNNKSRNKNDKTIKEGKTFNSIKNKLSDYWANGYEINLEKTFVQGYQYRELYIVFK